MRGRAALLWIALAIAGATTVACTEDARSPVGVDILPGGILEGGLESVASTAFSRATDYAIFPARRADGDRLPAALAWPEAPGIESRPIFRFVVSERADSLAGAEVLDAHVRLVHSLASAPSVPVTYTLHRVAAEWSEDAATWERRLLGAGWAVPGGDFDPDPVATFTVEPTTEEIDPLTEADTLEVPIPIDLVVGWQEGTIENHGLIVVQRTPGESVDFASRGGESGLNGNGPTLSITQRLDTEENPIVETTILAREDTFLPLDSSPLPGDPGLTVSAGDPTRRIFMRPTLDDVPTGATIAGARLVLTVAAAEVPADTFQVMALEAESDFLGEKTVYAPITESRLLGFQDVTGAVQPGDTLVFEGSRLTRVIRAWLAEPDVNRGFGVLAFEEGSGFGAVRFHGPDAAAELRPRFQLLILPPPAASGESR